MDDGGVALEEHAPLRRVRAVGPVVDGARGGHYYGLEAEQPKNNFKAEGDEIIKNLKNKESGAKYCYQFFFDTTETDEKGKTKKKLCQIAPLRSKMIYDFQKDFDVTLKPEYFSTIVYLALWADGTWGPLDSYAGRCSFYAWLRKVARNAVMERLVEEHLIDDVWSRTVGNTRLALLSQSPSKCKMVIDDLMVGSKYHGLLTAIYVDRLPEEKIMKKLHIKNTDEFTAAKKAGENKLKDAMLRSVEYSEEDILRDKKKHIVTVSSEFVADLSVWVKAKTGVNPLSNVFGTDLTDEEVHEKTVEFLYDFSAKLWPEKVGNPDETDEKTIKKNKEKAENNKRDRLIWCERFIKDSSPVDVANMVNHDRAWLDTRYSRLKDKFEKAIKEWWKSHAS